jgi:hypothetical protein
VKILKLIAEDKPPKRSPKKFFLVPERLRLSAKHEAKVGAKTIAGLVMYAMRNKLLE